MLRGTVVGMDLSCSNVVFPEAAAGSSDARAAIEQRSSTLWPTESSRSAISRSNRPTTISSQVLSWSFKTSSKLSGRSFSAPKEESQGLDPLAFLLDFLLLAGRVKSEKD